MVYPSGTGLPRLSWKKAVKWLCVCVFVSILFVVLNATVDEADLDVLPQEPIDEDDIIGLRWEDIAHASTGIYSLCVTPEPPFPLPFLIVFLIYSFNPF